MADKKIYVGSGRKKSPSWLQITVNPAKLKDHIQKYEGNEFVKLNININDQPDKFGKDVSVTIDTWVKPEGQQQQPAQQQQAQANTTVEPVDDLPF